MCHVRITMLRAACSHGSCVMYRERFPIILVTVTICTGWKLELADGELEEKDSVIRNQTLLIHRLNTTITTTASSPPCGKCEIFHFFCVPSLEG